MTPTGVANDELASWVEFYSDRGIILDPSAFRIPDKKPGFDRLIVVAKGVSSQWAYDECVKLFPCWKWTNQSLDEIIHSERTAKDGAYAVWIRERVEADEELKNLSADVLKQRGIPGISLEERLLYEAKYFEETGEHLDIKNITLCAGSRAAAGHVPPAHWPPVTGQFRVHGCPPGSSYPGLRSRAAVS